MMHMSNPLFTSVKRGGVIRREEGCLTLVEDMWDDFHFKTSYQLYLGTGEDFVRVGYVKIATVGVEAYSGHTQVPSAFSELPPDYYSLGQDREYYEKLRELLGPRTEATLFALRDIAADEKLLRNVVGEPALSTSLMRNIPQLVVETQFRRIINGLEVLSPYSFTFVKPPPNGNSPPFEARFDVEPGQVPPTNVHVLIGQNGVGKSQLLRDFVTVAVGSDDLTLGVFRDEMAPPSAEPEGLPFANVVHIAFSAFDSDIRPINDGRVKAHTVGLPAHGGPSLEDQFVLSLERCSKSPRRERWVAAIAMLAAADEILADEAIVHLLEPDRVAPESEAREKFRRMSSGHKIVVLTVSRLVELVEERSLVLLDEPETHLHPPLLSALTRAVSDLAVDRNGVAIIATHSPVVLQEVPRSCVKILRRSGDDFRAWALETESFGESVSRLTAEVFHLDVQRTGFHQVLREVLMDRPNVAEALAFLGGNLGSEGRFILHALANDERDVDA